MSYEYFPPSETQYLHLDLKNNAWQQKPGVYEELFTLGSGSEHIIFDEGKHVLKINYRLLAELYTAACQQQSDETIKATLQKAVSKRQQRMQLLNYMFGSASIQSGDDYRLTVTVDSEDLNQFLPANAQVSEGPALTLPFYYCRQKNVSDLIDDNCFDLRIPHIEREQENPGLTVDLYTEASERWFGSHNSELPFDSDLFNAVYPGQNVQRTIEALDDPQFVAIFKQLIEFLCVFWMRGEMLDLGGSYNMFFRKENAGYLVYILDGLSPVQPMYFNKQEDIPDLLGYLRDEVDVTTRGKMSRLLSGANYIRVLQGAMQKAGILPLVGEYCHSTHPFLGDNWKEGVPDTAWEKFLIRARELFPTDSNTEQTQKLVGTLALSRTVERVSGPPVRLSQLASDYDIPEELIEYHLRLAGIGYQKLQKFFNDSIQKACLEPVYDEKEVRQLLDGPNVVAAIKKAAYTFGELKAIFRAGSFQGLPSDTFSRLAWSRSVDFATVQRIAAELRAVPLARESDVPIEVFSPEPPLEDALLVELATRCKIPRTIKRCNLAHGLIGFTRYFTADEVRRMNEAYIEMYPEDKGPYIQLAPIFNAVYFEMIHSQEDDRTWTTYHDF